MTLKGLNKPAVASHATKTSSDSQRLRIYKAAALRRLAPVARRPHKARIVPEALGNTAECYLHLEGVCCCVASLKRGVLDESCREISGLSGAGRTGVSDLASCHDDTVRGDGGISCSFWKHTSHPAVRSSAKGKKKKDVK